MVISTHRQPRFQIERVKTENFRSIANATVGMEHLNVFVGPNASGKSNFLDIFRFIKDALQRDLHAAVAMRQGFDAISRRVLGEVSGYFQIEIAAITRGYESESFFLIEYGFRVERNGDNDYEVSSEFANISAHDNRDSIVEFKIERGNLISPQALVRENTQQPSFMDEYDTDFDPRDLALPAYIRFSRTMNRISDEFDATGRSIHDGMRALNLFFRHLLNMRFYHIFPNTIREPQKLLNGRYLDEDAVNLASVLRELEKSSPMYLTRMKEGLNDLIPGVVDVVVSYAGGYLIVRLKRQSQGYEEWFDLSQESDGTIRLLGLLTALNQHRVPLIGIEEPELTVHPGTMPALADLLKEASKRSQLIITTHSPDFIDCVSDYRTIQSLRIVESKEGITNVGPASPDNIEVVKRHLFSPGELHRMGELEIS